MATPLVVIIILLRSIRIFCNKYNKWSQAHEVRCELNSVGKFWNSLFLVSFSLSLPPRLQCSIAIQYFHRYPRMEAKSCSPFPSTNIHPSLFLGCSVSNWAVNLRCSSNKLVYCQVGVGGWLGCTRTGKLCAGIHHSFTETYLHRKVCLYLRNSISPLVEFLSFLYSFKVSFLNEETRGPSTAHQ